MQSSIAMYDRFLANFFFLFFTSPILSPSLYSGASNGNIDAGLTIYLYWLVFLVDFRFQAYLKHTLKHCIGFWCFVALVLFVFFCCVLGEYMVVLRSAIIALSVAYIKYSWDSQLFYLFRWMNFNILIAACQYVTLLYVPSVAELILPSNIASFIWGAHARITFNNFEGAFSDAALEDNIKASILGFEPIRVAGLSGEGGFFSALVLMSWLLCYLYTKNRKELLLLSVGLIMSLSKVTFLLLILLAVIKLKPIIQKTPYAAMVIALGLLLNIVSSWTIENLFLSETFMHRFAGYYACNFMDWNYMLWGLPKGTVLDSSYFSGLDNMLFFPYRFNTFSGYADLVYHIGYIGLLLWLLAIKKIGFGSYGLLMLVLSTITINLETATSFSILAWFIAFDFNLVEKRISDSETSHYQ